MSTQENLTKAVERACGAIRDYSAACARTPHDVSGIVEAGERLIQAVLDYEEALRAVSGWSNPMRHLGPLPFFAEGEDSSIGEEEGLVASEAEELGGIRMEVSARYRLHVKDEPALLALVSGRFGVEVSNALEAVESLYKAESWDPLRYPPGLMDLDCVEVEISGSTPRSGGGAV